MHGEMPSRRQILRTAWTTGLVSLALTAGASGVASAGGYHVYSCRTPSGEVAPTDGWTGSVEGTNDEAVDTCGTGGALTAALDAGATHVANVDKATWNLSVPAGETLAGATLWRAGDAD